MEERENKFWVSDNFLLLYAIQEASNIKPVLETRLQKIIYLSEVDSWKRGGGAFNYDFIKYYHGPYSFELKDDYETLLENNLAYYSEEYGYRLKPRAKQIIKEYPAIIIRNESVFDNIKKNAQLILKYPKREFQTMLDMIYKKRNPLNPKITIGNTELKNPLLDRNLWEKTLSPLQITIEEEESLEILLDPNLRNLVDEGRKSIQMESLPVWK